MIKTEISVIIPVYRIHDYLAQCLDSLLHQDIQVLYHIVLVETGSDDGSDLICKEYQEKYPSIVFWYHYPEHEGISAARNLGILHAAGKYITFIDGDDTVSKDYLSSLYQPFADHSNLMMTTASYQYQFADGKLVKGRSSSSFHGSGSVALKRMYTSSFAKMEHYAWNRMYNKKFLLANHLMFDSEVGVFEDLIFVSECLSVAGEVSYLKKNIYQYRQHSMSTMATSNDVLSYRLNAYKEVKEKLMGRNPVLAHTLFSSLPSKVCTILRQDAKSTAKATGKNEKELFSKALKEAKEIFRR